MSVARSTFEPTTTNASQNGEVASDTASIEFETHSEDLTEKDVKTIHRALADNALTEERRWRILQMIMQCSIPDLEHVATAQKALTSLSETDTTSATHILLLLEKLKKTPSSFFLPALQHRMRLMDFHVVLERQVQHEKDQMKYNSDIRKRLSAGGQKLEPLPSAGLSVKTRALNAIIAAGGDNTVPQKRLRQQMDTYATCGSNLKFLVLKLGLGLLLALPSCTVYQCDVKLRPSPSSRHCKNIEPSE
jgi:hypothetical protein